MGKLQRVLIMAGGTGGHVFPGLAVAKKLQQQGVQVDWLGTQKGLESRLVPEANLPIHFITISGIRGKGWKDLVLAPWRITNAVMQSIRIIRQLNPDVILGMGGFVSGPGGIASWILRKPLVIHEQNAKPGTTNKWLAKVAKKVLQGFPKTFSLGTTVGNPVRAEIAAIPPPDQRFSERKKPLQLLVLGGSLGAAAINEKVPLAIAKLPAAARPLVYHQAGDKHLDSTLAVYQQVGVEADVVPFITDMAKAYAWADIVLCRAGALTIAELCAAGTGAILVPFPYATDDHQTANAKFMVEGQAAYLIPQAELNEDKLSQLLSQLSIEACQKMANAAYSLRNTDATDKVLMVCEEISH